VGQAIREGPRRRNARAPWDANDPDAEPVALAGAISEESTFSCERGQICVLLFPKAVAMTASAGEGHWGPMEKSPQAFEIAQNGDAN